MKFLSAASALLLASFAQAITVSYDNGYDDGSRSLTAVSCSDGANGLITRYGWQTQSQVKGFPYIGGASTVAGWNSPSCGTCYTLSYNGNSIHVLAIDHAAQGFNIAQEALDELTNGQAVALGRIDAGWEEVSPSVCGL